MTGFGSFGVSPEFMSERELASSEKWRLVASEDATEQELHPACGYPSKLICWGE